jgi:hypothetical protein
MTWLGDMHDSFLSELSLVSDYTLSCFLLLFLDFLLLVVIFLDLPDSYIVNYTFASFESIVYEYWSKGGVVLDLVLLFSGVISIISSLSSITF